MTEPSGSGSASGDTTQGSASSSSGRFPTPLDSTGSGGSTAADTTDGASEYCEPESVEPVSALLHFEPLPEGDLELDEACTVTSLDPLDASTVSIALECETPTGLAPRGLISFTEPVMPLPLTVDQAVRLRAAYVTVDEVSYQDIAMSEPGGDLLIAQYRRTYQPGQATDARPEWWAPLAIELSDASCTAEPEDPGASFIEDPCPHAVERRAVNFWNGEDLLHLGDVYRAPMAGYYFYLDLARSYFPIEGECDGQPFATDWAVIIEM